MPKDKKSKSGYKPSEKELDVIEHVSKRKHQMEDSKERQRAIEIFDQGEKQWEQFRSEDDSYEWQAKYYVPLTTSVIESTLSELIESIPEPHIIPRSPEDAPKAKVMQAIFEYTWDVANGEEEMMKIMRGALLHGTAFAQEYYLQDRRKVKEIIGLSDKRNKKKQRDFDTEEKEVLEYDDVMMEWVSPYDIFVDENAREINKGAYKARDIIRRQITSYDAAEAFFRKDPAWDHLNNFRFVVPGSGDTFYSEFFTPPEGFDKSNDVEILWYWSRQPEDMMAVIINGVPVRIGPNVFKHKQLPIAKAIDVERLGKFYGKGEPELLASIQDEVNRMRRMVMDRHHLDIDKTFLISQNSAIDEDDLIARPHGLIPVDDPSSVRPVEYGDIPISVERTFRAINEDKIAVTGIDDRFQSVQKAPSTATEAAILKESTLKRIKMKLANFEKRFLVDIGRQRIANIMQFYSQPRLEKIVGEKKTDEYKKEIARLSREGMLEVKDGEPFRKKFRQITTEGKKLFFDERGEVKQRKEPGFHFFEAKPDFFMPHSPEGFDIRFKAGPSMPVSKPLMQQKITEMYDRLIEVAMSGETSYDPEKLADKLVESNELDPEDLKNQEALEEESIEENRIALAVDLAGQENEMVLQGKEIPPNGTPFAPPPHTQVHIAFLQSEQMVNAPQDIYDKLLQHTVGEIELIKRRAGEQGAAQGAQQQEQLSPGEEAAQAVPGLMQGGGDVPEGQVFGG